MNDYCPACKTDVVANGIRCCWCDALVIKSFAEPCDYHVTAKDWCPGCIARRNRSKRKATA